MQTLSSLPADQASALRLLSGGTTYRAVADLLGLTEDSVASTALTGLDALAPQEAKALTEMERRRVADVVLGQSGSDPLIQGSPAAGAYAARLRAALGSGLTAESTQTEPPTKVIPLSSKPPISSPPAASKDPKNSGTVPMPEHRRRGLLLLMGVAAVAVVVAIVINTSSGGSDQASMSSSAVTTTTTTNAASASGGWTIRDRFTLKPVAGGSGQALAGLGTKTNSAAILIAGNGLQAGSTIGIWLTGPSSSGLIGLGKVDTKGQFSGIGPIPKNVASATEIVVTQEQATTAKKVPASPGPVLLKAAFKVS